MTAPAPTEEQTTRYVGYLAAGILAREPFTTRAAALAESMVIEAHQRGWDHVPGSQELRSSPILDAADSALQQVRAMLAEQREG